MPRPISINCYKTLVVLLVCTLCAYYSQSAEAKLGEPLEKFQQKMASSFKLINKEIKPPKTYYHFSLVSRGEEQKLSSGFGSGLTITTLNGRIIGESLLVRLGNNKESGEKLAAVLCLNLAYDALAKPVPSEDKDKRAEFDSYTQAVSQALRGQPGHIKYPGHNGELIFSRTKDGDLLFAINSATQTKAP